MKKTVLITGASRGIGAACAEVFAEKGYWVAISYYENRQKAEDLIRTLREKGHTAMMVKADVSDSGAVESMIDEVLRQFGSIDVLVNNAGIAQQKLLMDMSDGEWNRMMQVNVNGVFFCCRKVLPAMLRKKKGKIINISSMWGMTGACCEVAYSASKAAVIGFTKALAKEVGPSGISVNCVAPGVVLTDMCASFSRETLMDLEEETPLRRLGKPDDIAHAVSFLASSEADFITGQILCPNGGFVI